MLDTEIKILSAIDITDDNIKMAENQVRMRERLKALTEEVEQPQMFKILRLKTKFYTIHNSKYNRV